MSTIKDQVDKTTIFVFNNLCGFLVTLPVSRKKKIKKKIYLVFFFNFGGGRGYRVYVCGGRGVPGGGYVVIIFFGRVGERSCASDCSNGKTKHTHTPTCSFQGVF